ncbi:TlpA family protein disulfide reductase [Olleya sp. 1-3]|uniref:TlpA family protein disulfide reductase n=1 Tax=Olleya sp. 1-3 TaxID=2058323 RepID=UPI0012FF042C|nr:TlpA disulfide reductase family protein [Olleya sp. 1-3]
MNKIKLLFALTFLIFSCSEKEPNFYKNLYTNEIYTTLEYDKFIGDLYLKVSDSIIEITNPSDIKQTRDSLLKEIRVTSKLKKIIKSGDSIIRPFEYDLRIGNEYLIRSDNFEKIGLEITEKKHKTLEGEEIVIGGKQDKPTLVNLWFIGCRGCIEEMPALNLLKSKYADKVNFVALTFDNNEDVIKFLNKKEFNFTHLTNKKEFIKEIGTKPYPENIFIDKNGFIKYIEGGIGSGDNLNLVIEHFEKILEELINE